MERRVLIIPLNEVNAHFGSNDRQDVKIVAPELLSQQLFELLQAKGRAVKQEKKLTNDTWSHSEKDQPNLVIESNDFFVTDTQETGFTVAFANEKAEQDSHYHPNHSEIYFSEHPFEARYRIVGETEIKEVKLENGGLIIFSPNVVHKVKFQGLTLIIELPSVAGDKISEEV